MYSIGIIKKIDSVGRVTIPKDFRSLFSLEKDGNIEMIATEQGIILRNPERKTVRTQD